MKKIVILALSAIFVANISAQEMKNEKCDGKKFNKEERVELDIRRFTNELMLSDQQAEKFAVTYREYSAKMDELFKKNKVFNRQQGKVLTDAELDQKAKQRFESFKDLADLQSKYYDKFRKDLSARQVTKVLRFDEPFGHKHACGKHQCKFDAKHHDKFDCKHADKASGKIHGRPIASEVQTAQNEE